MKQFFSREAVVRDLRTAVVAVIAASIVVATPSVAAKVTNSDKVDGKHAVSAKASIDKRAGKLVATDQKGLLPNNIVAKPADADKLDGLDSSALVRGVAKPGSVQTGLFNSWGSAFIGDSSQFISRLPVRIPEVRTTFIASGEATTSNCPGVGQVVPRAWLCVYESNGGNRTYGGVFERANTYGAGRDGFGIYLSCNTAASCFSYGDWAVRAGAASDVPNRGAVRRNGPAPH